MHDTKYIKAPPLLAELAELDGAELTLLYARLLERISTLDPLLRIFDDASLDASYVMKQCARLAERWPFPGKRPALFGLPVGVKAIIRVAGRSMRCGSLLPADLFDGKESLLVRRLRKAGALIMGHTVSTEFAYFEPGPTCNPHHCAYTPGGSSSGSAAGVAAGFFSLGLGTQTVGSTIRPASYCGVTGFKPSYGRLPVDGIIPFSPSADHPGFFATSAHELAYVMAVLDPSWRPCALPRRLRLALPTGPYLSCALPQTQNWLHVQIKLMVERLKQQGCLIDLIELPCFDDMDDLIKSHELLIAAEAAQVHRAWFARFAQLYRPRTAELLRQGGKEHIKDVDAARASRLALRLRIQTLMEKHAVDFWCCPSSVGEADCGLSGTGSPVMNLPWSHAGLPALSLPLACGSQGLPLGMQVVGAFGKDESLLAAGMLMLPA